MLGRHHKLWILFALCLLMILPAMIWLTFKAVKTDRELIRDRRETELARRQAEVQERISSALYRMDWKLGPHIAREAARPYYLYQSFYKIPGADKTSLEIPSPLLSQTSDFVKLHFQIDVGNQFTTPQRPKTEEKRIQAFLCCDLTQQTFDQREALLADAKSLCSYESILSQIESSDIFDQGEFDLAAQNVYVQPQAQNFANKFRQQKRENESRNKGALVKELVAKQLKGKSKIEVQEQRGASRGGEEFVQRQKAYGINTQQWAQDNRAANAPAMQAIQSEGIQVVEGVMRPIWIENNLLLARLVEVEHRNVIQCCWLAWDKIQQALRDEVSDILPGAVLQPVIDNDMLVPDRALVTLPVQVVVDSQNLLASTVIQGDKFSRTQFSGLQVALWLAWAGLILSAIAIGSLVYAVLQLSERRAAFVSAVTHELRTPLTTFKMYSEMLAEKMVPEEKQVQYAQTLKLQAERLSHLVENVLQFARLERGGDNSKVEAAEMRTILSGIETRLQELVDQSKRKLNYQISTDVLNSKVKIESHVIEQILFNLVDNACKYSKDCQDPRIEVFGKLKNSSTIELTVRDFGPGVCSSVSDRVFQAFRKSDLDAANSAPGVGLGLALCRRMVKSFKGRIGYANVEPGARFYVEIPVAR